MGPFATDREVVVQTSLYDQPDNKVLYVTKSIERDDIPHIADAVRMGGVVHFYTFKKRQQIEGLSKKYMDMGLEVRLCRRCGNVAPGVSRWAFDLVKC